MINCYVCWPSPLFTPKHVGSRMIKQPFIDHSLTLMLDYYTSHTLVETSFENPLPFFCKTSGVAFQLIWSVSFEGSLEFPLSNVQISTKISIGYSYAIGFLDNRFIILSRAS